MRPFRYVAALFACIAAVALATSGCGGSNSSSSDLGTVLAYVPADTPFALELDTDIGDGQYKALDAILHRFAGADTIKALIKSQLTLGVKGLDFDKDVKPLLGNPAVISATDVGSFLSNSEQAGFVAALQVDDKDALKSLIDKTKPVKRGEVGGATVYQDADSFFAVKDDVVVLAGSRSLLEAALKRADGGGHLSESDFEAGLNGLPADAFARVYVNVQGLLSKSEGARAARRIEWVAALRTVGLTVSAEKKSIDVEFNAVTKGDDLTDADLPFATGDEAAKVVKRKGEIGVGLRNPRQLFAFFESALQAVDPQTFGEYEQGKRAIAAKLNLDIDKDLVAQLTGNVSVSATIAGDFAARAEVKDPAAFTKTVDKVAKALPELGSTLGIEGVRRSGDLYEARLSGGSSIFFGMAQDSLVVASDAARAHSIAATQPEAVPGASGSLVLSADAEGVARQIIAKIAPQFGIPDPIVPILASPFDELNGWVTTSTDGLKGKLSLTFD
jgi:Protein of unknown function (DUF3352)